LIENQKKRESTQGGDEKEWVRFREKGGGGRLVKKAKWET